MNEIFPRSKRRSFGGAMVALVGHIGGTAALFVVVLGIIWLAGWAAELMHATHPFPEPVWTFVVQAKLGLVYIDAALCAAIILSGAWTFFAETVGARR